MGEGDGSGESESGESRESGESGESHESGRLSSASSLTIDSIGSMKSTRKGAKSSTKKVVLTGGVKNAMVAVTRYLSNNFSDDQRQKNMDQFLGLVEPSIEEREDMDPEMQELLDKGESMCIAVVSKVPTLLCMQVLRKSQQRTFEEKHAPSKMTSFASLIGLKNNKTKEKEKEKEEEEARAAAIPHILITADEISSTLDNRSFVLEEGDYNDDGGGGGGGGDGDNVENEDEEELYQLSSDQMWRVASRYDEWYERQHPNGEEEGIVEEEMTAEFDDEDLHSYAMYAAYCGRARFLQHFVFDERGKVYNMLEEGKREEQEQEDQEQQERKSWHDKSDDGHQHMPRTLLPPLYQDGAFTRLSNRRDSWMGGTGGGGVLMAVGKKKEKKKKTKKLRSKFFTFRRGKI